MRSIAGLFAKSPFGPLAEHTQRVHETVVLVRPLFEAFLDEDWAKTDELYEQISRLEHKADVLKNDIRDHLPKSLFLPVDRGDVLIFLEEQDKIADKVEDVAVILTMRRTTAPAAMRAGVLALVDSVIETSEAWYDVSRQLPRLQEAAFAGPDVEKTIQRINNISGLEWEADKRQAEISKHAFEYEDELGAVSIMMWMNIFRVLGSIANRAESTADLLRLMLAKR